MTQPISQLQPHTPRLNPLVLVAVALVTFVTASPAFAVSKDMVELQTQIHQLQDAVARLQQSNDERMGVLKDLVQQSADSVNKMSLTVDTLQKQMLSQQANEGGKIDQVSSQVQAISDSVEEVKARLNRLEKAVKDVQNQQQSINAGLQNLATTPSAGTTASGGTMTPQPDPSIPPPVTTPVPAPLTPPPAAVAKKGKPAAGVPLASASSDPVPAATTPPVGDLYKAALSDYMAAKYTLASSEFTEVAKNYPEDTLAGNAFYYLGEMDYRAGKFPVAVKDYDHVLEQYPDNPKIPVSHLHKGQALLVLKQNDAGVRELRTLIQRFPNSPEATQARSRLNGMGVPIVPKVAAR